MNAYKYEIQNFCRSVSIHRLSTLVVIILFEQYIEIKKMRANTCTFSKPHIEFYKRLDRSRLQPLGRKFHCTFQGCKKTFYTLRNYDIHSETEHMCAACGKCFDHLKHHSCTQTGSGKVGPPTAIPPKLNSGLFKLTQSFHRGTILDFMLSFKHLLLESVSNVFEYVYEDLKILIAQLISH